MDIFQAIFADLSPLEAYDFADSRNNLSGEPLLFTQPNFVCETFLTRSIAFVFLLDQFKYQILSTGFLQREKSHETFEKG